MTEQERKEAIQKLESPRKQGILTDDEYVQKIAGMAKPVQKDDEPEKPAHTGRYALVFIAFFLIVGIMAVISTQNENRKSATTPTQTTTKTTRSYPYGVPAAGYTDSGSTFNAKDKELAMTFAQVYVKRQLKSPSTAKFPSNVDSYTYKREGNEWAVAGWVDATNSYGATIRTTWVSSFTITWDGGKYHGEEVGTYIVE
jgi:hypothetical protein